MEPQPLAHCAKCRTETKTNNVTFHTSSNNRPMMKGQCILCGTGKSAFLKVKNKTEENGLSKPDSK